MLTRRYLPSYSPTSPPGSSFGHPLTSPLSFQPAKTEAGAFTTQDADNAHTTAGTSAEDPNIPGSGKLGGVQGQVDNSTSLSHNPPVTKLARIYQVHIDRRLTRDEQRSTSSPARRVCPRALMLPLTRRSTRRSELAISMANV